MAQLPKKPGLTKRQKLQKIIQELTRARLPKDEFDRLLESIDPRNLGKRK